MFQAHTVNKGIYNPVSQPTAAEFTQGKASSR